MKKNKMNFSTKCLICGDSMESGTCTLPTKEKGRRTKIFPKIICDNCSQRGVTGEELQCKTVKRVYNGTTIKPYCDLAAAIEKGVIRTYRIKYLAMIATAYDNLDSWWESQLSDEEIDFLSYHNQITSSYYHNILTFGNLCNVLDRVRADIDDHSYKSHVLRLHGYNIFRREQEVDSDG